MLPLFRMVTLIDCVAPVHIEVLGLLWLTYVAPLPVIVVTVVEVVVVVAVVHSIWYRSIPQLAKSSSETKLNDAVLSLYESDQK